jgi:hypothetical protein
LNADEAPGDFQPPTPPPGYSWWPTHGLNSLDDLKLYVEDHLDQMISQQDGPLAEFGLALGVQAFKNADRYLGLHGSGDHPPRPGDEQLQHAEVAEDALEAVIRYLRAKQQPQPDSTPKPTVPASPTATADEQTAIRGWKQPELDEAVRAFIEQHAGRLAGLRDSARAYRKDAIEAARALVGRNVIARALGVKAPAMVSKTPAYRQLSDEFHLERERSALRKAVGLEIGIEDKAVAEEDPVLAEVCKREAAEFIRSKLDEEDAELLLGQLEGGNISPDKAMVYAQAMLENKDDTRTSRKPR